MTVTYCTAQNVADFLQVTAFSTTTTPTSTVVETRINEAEDYIDNYTGHAWRETTVSNEYHNIDRYYVRTTGFPVFLNHRHVRELDSEEDDALEVWDGNSWTDWLSESSRTEARNRDYWLRYEDGVLYLRKWTIYPVGVRVTYRFGETTVPKPIQKAAILLTAIDLVGSDDRSVLLPETGGSQVNYLNKIEKWEAQANRILDDYQEFRISTR
jgi:hypothetical protein